LPIDPSALEASELQSTQAIIPLILATNYLIKLTCEPWKALQEWDQACKIQVQEWTLSRHAPILSKPVLKREQDLSTITFISVNERVIKPPKVRLGYFLPQRFKDGKILFEELVDWARSHWHQEMLKVIKCNN